MMIMVMIMIPGEIEGTEREREKKTQDRNQLTKRERGGEMENKREKRPTGK